LRELQLKKHPTQARLWRLRHWEMPGLRSLPAQRADVFVGDDFGWFRRRFLLVASAAGSISTD